MAREYLIALRKQRCETQQAVAKSIGVTRQNYSQIENGIRQQRMDIVTAKHLADHFSVDVSFIVSEETKSAFSQDSDTMNDGSSQDVVSGENPPLKMAEQMT